MIVHQRVRYSPNIKVLHRSKNLYLQRLLEPKPQAPLKQVIGFLNRGLGLVLGPSETGLELI